MKTLFKIWRLERNFTFFSSFITFLYPLEKFCLNFTCYSTYFCVFFTFSLIKILEKPCPNPSPHAKN